MNPFSLLGSTKTFQFDSLTAILVLGDWVDELMATARDNGLLLDISSNRQNNLQENTAITLHRDLSLDASLIDNAGANSQRTADSTLSRQALLSLLQNVFRADPPLVDGRIMLTSEDHIGASRVPTIMHRIGTASLPDIEHPSDMALAVRAARPVPGLVMPRGRHPQRADATDILRIPLTPRLPQGDILDNSELQPA